MITAIVCLILGAALGYVARARLDAAQVVALAAACQRCHARHQRTLIDRERAQLSANDMEWYDTEPARGSRR